MTNRKPTTNGVRDAAKRIEGAVTRTPLLPLDRDGRRLWVKAECLQQGGAFKLRGATNRLMQLDESQRAAGVVAFSSGNHAQGVALAARRLAMPAVIVMPADAPAVKVEGTRGFGAEIVFAPCGMVRHLNVNTELRVTANSSNQSAFVSMDSTDGSVNTRYQFAWKRC